MSPKISYGENVFSIRVMKNYLSEKAFASLSKTIKEGGLLDPSIADEVADAMKNWALEKGATHFTHWFQPLTGGTAEKHTSFIVPDREGGAMLQFSGSELVQGEADASSFPSGGLRATFEARGYTAWDPTSPAFIKEGVEGATLCIPTIFCGYHGETLDTKMPLLRSKKALISQIERLGKLFGVKGEQKPYIALGPEQEYFLIDRDLYFQRMDLLQTGRTLFGRVPAKHQQLEDHYFGAIKLRVMAFMEDLDRELWKMGIPAKTRHNEVAPSQFEIVPVYEEVNLAIDHNMLLMEILRTVAEKHHLACLLHEKPFQGVNGSGKHNNWSICGTDGKNWLSPGENPHENVKFITLLCAVMEAIDTYAGLLRSSIASAGNDHRLGAHEAPPAILSIFLGEHLCDMLEQIENNKEKTSKKAGHIDLGVESLSHFPKDISDRNRTSPFAFTGSKFEFRSVGSNMHLAHANTVLNTIVAESLDGICSRLESALAAGKNFDDTLQKILQDIITAHKRILFNGDNYTENWRLEAKKRGLLDLRTTPEALQVLKDPSTIKLFEKHQVFTAKELLSRYEIYMHHYYTVIAVEAKCVLSIVKSMIIPVGFRYLGDLSSTYANQKSALLKQWISKLSDILEHLGDSLSDLEERVHSEDKDTILEAMQKVRLYVDALEEIIPSDEWPLPTYGEMMFW